MATNEAANGNAGGFTNASFGGSGGNDDSTGGYGSGGGSSRRMGRSGGSDSDDSSGVDGGALPPGSTAGNLTKLMDGVSRKYGLDPRIMEGIRTGESGHSQHYDIGDIHNGPAYGPLQLNVGKGRLGWKFEKETHLNLRDPKTIPAQVEWVAKYIRKRLEANPRYSPGGEWFGFHGLRNANPRWGDSGYKPSLTPSEPKKATGLASNAETGSAKAAAATQGHIRADIHVHGNTHKATVKTTGRIEASLHRWPTMSGTA
jgi:hypothetical protein